MKHVSKIYLTLFAVALAAFLSGCGSKSGSGGKTAATPGSSCKWNAQYGTYLDSQGRYCNAYNNTQSCIAKGLQYDSWTKKWYDMNGNVVACSDGGQWGNNGYVPYNGYYNGWQVNGCEGWNYYYYPDQYIPMDIGGGQMICANMKWIGGYYPQVYNYPYSYYQYNPMYAWNQYDSGWGGGYGYSNCSSQLGINFSNWTGGSGFGVGGYICF